MPKETFYNLPEAKKQQVMAVIKQEFKEHPISQASVKDIVTTLGIARGSFYSYFENLEESYFLILDQETVEVHELFVHAMVRSQGDLILALEYFGQAAAEELFTEDKAALYRNRYLYWTPELDQQWKKYRENSHHSNSQLQEADLLEQDDPSRVELMHFIKAVVHDLIRRLFVEGWDKATFLKHYHLQLGIMRLGLSTLLKQGETNGNI